jgi:hypothetical protein
MNIRRLIISAVIALSAAVTGFASATLATNLAPETPAPVVTQWEEDSLPDEMYRYVDAHGADLQNWSDRDVDGHVGCWAAVADTTLVMCPDGFTTTS